MAQGRAGLQFSAPSALPTNHKQRHLLPYHQAALTPPISSRAASEMPKDMSTSTLQQPLKKMERPLTHETPVSIFG